MTKPSAKSMNQPVSHYIFHGIKKAHKKVHDKRFARSINTVTKTKEKKQN